MTYNLTSKSFILHKDSLTILDQLTDQQAGKLLKAIYFYQKTGKNSDLDQMTKIIITPFLNQFNRDNDKYQNSAIQGKLGNLKKYHLAIYQKVIDKELTLEEGESLAYPDKQLLYRPPITPDQSGSLSVSVSVSDKVSDSEKDNKSKKETEIQFDKIYRLFNQGKTIRIIPFEKYKTRFNDCLKNISFEELEENIKNYLAYLALPSESWRSKKAFEAWINSSEFYANDWKNEKYDNKKTVETNLNAPLVDYINKICKHTAVTSISVSASNKAILKVPSKADYEILRNLPKDDRDKIKIKISKDLGTKSEDNIEFKF